MLQPACGATPRTGRSPGGGVDASASLGDQAIAAGGRANNPVSKRLKARIVRDAQRARPMSQRHLTVPWLSDWCYWHHSCASEDSMDREELTKWALTNGWQMIAGTPCLTKPSSPKDPIVRLVFKATLVNVEIKKPVGKWEKVSGAAYNKIESDPETGLPLGLGFDTINGFAALMEDNKNRAVFAKPGG
jgi:hypothetical protein